MASIKQLSARKYKITVSNGYRPDGRKISKAKTIQVPSDIPKRGISQYVAHAAEEFEREVKNGYSEDGEMTFEEYALRWLARQTKYAPSTLASYAGRKLERKVADEETAQQIIAALEQESIKYETYFKLIIATGMRRGECCALQWQDIDWVQRTVHICRNAVKVTGDEIFVKEPKTRSGDRYVYFSAEMESVLREYKKECQYITTTYDGRELADDDFLFRRQGTRLPMTPTTFTWRFKCILKKHCLPEYLNVHSLRHTAASLMIANGTDVATVAGLLGHSQPSTTLDIYTHAFDKNKKAASQAMQSSLEI